MLLLPNRDILFAVDPGLMTGLAVLDVSDLDDPKPLEDYELGVEDFFDKMAELFPKYHTDHIHIVCEDFIITVETAKKTPQPYSLWLIGVLQYMAYRFDASFEFQKPADKAFIPNTKEGNTKLRKVGFWTKGGEGHQHDAYRHAAIWVVNKNPNWAKNLLM